MNRYTASYKITRRRTVVEEATVTREIRATSFGTAGAAAEVSAYLSVSDAEFVTVSDTGCMDSVVLESISFDGPPESEPAACCDSPADDDEGLTPALYGPSTSPSGQDYYPVQVEPTPDPG